MAQLALHMTCAYTACDHIPHSLVTAQNIFLCLCSLASIWYAVLKMVGAPHYQLWINVASSPSLQLLFEIISTVSCRTCCMCTFLTPGIFVYLTPGHPRVQGAADSWLLSLYIFLCYYCFWCPLPYASLPCRGAKSGKRRHKRKCSTVNITEKYCSTAVTYQKCCTDISILLPQPKLSPLCGAYWKVLTCPPCCPWFRAFICSADKIEGKHEQPHVYLICQLVEVQSYRQQKRGWKPLEYNSHQELKEKP